MVNMMIFMVNNDDQLGRKTQPGVFSHGKLGNPANQPWNPSSEILTDVEVAAVGCSRGSELKWAPGRGLLRFFSFRDDVQGWHT